MRGYWNKPEETKKVFNAEGWFLTGDVGVVDREGFLTITDRKKELIINAYGKNIAPAPIEEALKHIRYVANVVLIGDKRKFLSALIVPNFERLEGWASANGVEFRNPTDLIRNPKVRALFRQAIEIVNGDEPSEKRIRDFAFLTTDFSIEGGELTPTLKVKRRVVAEKYKDMIDGLYEKAELMDAAVDKSIGQDDVGGAPGSERRPEEPGGLRERATGARLFHSPGGLRRAGATRGRATRPSSARAEPAERVTAA